MRLGHLLLSPKQGQYHRRGLPRRQKKSHDSLHAAEDGEAQDGESEEARRVHHVENAFIACPDRQTKDISSACPIVEEQFHDSFAALKYGEAEDGHRECVIRIGVGPEEEAPRYTLIQAISDSVE